VRVAGRIERLHNGGLRLADAFAEIALEPPAGQRLRSGDLVVVAGELGPTGLGKAKLIDRARPAEPPEAATASPPASETARLRTEGRAEALRLRARVLDAVRSFFSERGFIEVDTPALVPSPGLDVHLDAFEVRDHRGKPCGYLSTSPELQMKRLLSGGLPRIFQIAHCFRAGELGPQHNPEFLMLEWYRAFAEMDALVAETEELVRHLVLEHVGRPELDIAGHRVDVSAPFERLAVGEAFARHASVAADEAVRLASDDEERFFRLLVERIEPALAQSPRPVFLVDFPAPLASLARLKPGAPELCERFELYLGGVELCNGFGELSDPREQRRRFEDDQQRRAALAKPVYPVDERFLGALEQGMPPAAGNALGLDRLIALCAGAQAVANVQGFPAGWL